MIGLNGDKPHPFALHPVVYSTIVYIIRIGFGKEQYSGPHPCPVHKQVVIGYNPILEIYLIKTSYTVCKFGYCIVITENDCFRPERVILGQSFYCLLVFILI